MGCSSSKTLAMKGSQAEIASTIQELLSCSPELAPLIAHPAAASSSGTPAQKKIFIQLQKKIANNPKLLYFIKEYLESITKVKESKSIDGQFQLDIKHQQMMAERLHGRMLKLKKKLRSVKKWRKASSIVCKAVHAAGLICSVVYAAVGAAAGAVPAPAAVVTAVTNLVKLMGEWLDSLWAGWRVALEGELEIVTKMLPSHPLGF